LKKKNFRQAKRTGPPELLHIYCLEGLLPTGADDDLGSGFLGNWQEGPCSFLFFEEPALERVLELISRHSGLGLMETHVFSYEEWQGAAFDPFELAGFEIRPAWDRRDTNVTGAKRIWLDPGVVFGSGLHPTTRDCLRALDWIWMRDCPKTVLDIGTGTGILAVATVMLGAERVFAADLNPLCVRVAADNAVLNGVEADIKALHLDALDAAKLEGDLVIANIHFDVICGLLEQKVFRCRHWLVLSGLMRTQVREVKDRLLTFGMRVVREWDCDMTWHTLAVRGNGH